MARSVDEWIGRTPDAKVPAHVQLRIFRRENGRCHISGQKIEAGTSWQLEHKTALSLGGEHREMNLFPALIEPHKVKSAEEAAIRAKADAVAKRHVGITKPAGQIKSAPFPGKKAPRTDRIPMPQRKVDIYGRPI